ncbi:hypothetical protein GCM10007190_12260 [Macrococcus hajekii]|uniref:DUF1798 family protein n=1 Tax=Macrococcus hajekii TaxID=198482 RepID=UPI00140986AD|nr:DUF1798 family protein [Macrococcus hajekii]GGB05776.1 hypothetical protein GCM10007190_12260 [Macrococcus hajekii]
MRYNIESLIDDIKKIEAYYDAARTGREFNFVLDIQPFTEQVDAHLSELMTHKTEILKLPLMNELKMKLFILHIRELSVECFFEKTSKKVFIDKLKAVQHDLHYLERKL